MSRADLCGGDCACVDVTEVQLKPLRVGECTVHFVSLLSHNKEHSTAAGQGRARRWRVGAERKVTASNIPLEMCSDLNIFNDNKSEN